MVKGLFNLFFYNERIIQITKPKGQGCNNCKNYQSIPGVRTKSFWVNCPDGWWFCYSIDQPLIVTKFRKKIHDIIKYFDYKINGHHLERRGKIGHW